MIKKIFNISEWLPIEEPKKNVLTIAEEHTDDQQFKVTDQVIHDIEIVVSRIEAVQADITSHYMDWVKLGYALSNTLGEGGRDYFQRVSRFYPQYDVSACDLQYNHCLNAKDKRTNICTFFFMASQAGIDIDCGLNNGPFVEPPEPILDDATVNEPFVKHLEESNLIYNTPQLPTEVYSNLPLILGESCELFSEGIEKDVFVIAALAVLSGCLPNIEGIYFDERYSAHLYSFITAPAGSGKGKMKWAKYFGQVIHDRLTEQSQLTRAAYETELEHYNNLSPAQKQSAEKPVVPLRKMFYIPANSSSSAFTQALADNNFKGVIFETEADTLANTTKHEWGAYDDILRKAFHHETTSQLRKKDNEFTEITDPHLAIVLSGTPQQVHNMMPEVENGLFSRFLYYAFEDNAEFKNPFVSSHAANYNEFFKQKGLAIFDLYQQLQNMTHPLIFKLTDEQGIRFTTIFNNMLTKDKLLLGNDFNANVKRLGIIHFRIAMILTALRILEDGELPNPMICSDQDFETAMIIVTTLEKHAIAIYNNMPNNGLKGKKLDFYNKLPLKFDRQGYLKVAAELGIKPKTAEYYISQFQPKLIVHDDHNDYTKIAK